MSFRTIAIGDIHGCAKALEALLDAIVPESTDSIVTLGDYIDRGQDSQGVLELLLDLRTQCRLIPILGNHEEMLLQVKEGRLNFGFWLDCGGAETLDSYGGKGALNLAAIPAEHFMFFEQCVNYHETEHHFFVHANYVAKRSFRRQDAHTLRWLTIWDSLPTPHYSGKTAIVGHSEIRNERVLDLGYLKAIDTCCFAGGLLTALDVESGQVWQANANGELRE